MKWTLSNYLMVGASLLLQLATAFFLLKKNQVRTFPLFFAYTVFHIANQVLGVIAFHISYIFYFYEFWTGEMLDILLTLAVIQEIFLVAFKPYEALRRWGSGLYIAATLLLCSVAVIMGVQHPKGYSPLVSTLLTLNRSSNFVTVGLLFFLFLFCQLFGLTWRHYVFGIASGFALMGSIITATEAVRTHFGSAVDGWTKIIEPAGFTLGVAVWTYYFASSKSRVALDQVPGTEHLIAWNQALAEIGRR